MELSDFAREAKNLVETPKTAYTRSVSSAPVYTIEAASYPDIVISRKTAVQTKMLVLMPTQNSFYIKTMQNSEKSKKPPEIARLNNVNLRNFCKDSDVRIPDNFWFQRLPRDAEESNMFIEYISFDDIGSMLKDGAVMPLYYGQMNYRCVLSNTLKNFYRKYPSLFRYFRNNRSFIELITDNCKAMESIVDHYGIDNSRKFFETILMNSLVDVKSLNNGWRMEQNIGQILSANMQIDAFIDYMCYESVCMGYGLTIYKFIAEWSDTIRMQMKLYGKIKEKYPKNLQTYHDKLSYMCELKREEIEEKGFEEHAEKTKKLCKANVGEWIFIAPHKREDFYEEAHQQANCLASYVRKFAEGKDYIVFMRKAYAPEESVITIELDLNGDIVQMYRARNKQPSDEEVKIAKEWNEIVKERMKKN